MTGQFPNMLQTYGRLKGDLIMEASIFHNSHIEKYRYPFGAVTCGSVVVLGLTVRTSNLHTADVIIRAEEGGERRIALRVRNRSKDVIDYSADIDIPEEKGLLWYHFELIIDGKKYYYGNNERSLGGAGRIYDTVPPPYQITVLRKDAKTPLWYKKAIMYQIFVDRFRNGNKDEKVLNPKKNSFIYANWDDTPVYIKNCENGKI